MAEDKPKPEPALTVELGKPVDMGGEIIAKLEFREPVGRDLTQCGMPCTWDMSTVPPSVTFDAAKMTAMMSQLSASGALINRLAANDWSNAAHQVAFFFIPMPAPRPS